MVWTTTKTTMMMLLPTLRGSLHRCVDSSLVSYLISKFVYGEGFIEPFVRAAPCGDDVKGRTKFIVDLFSSLLVFHKSSSSSSPLVNASSYNKYRVSVFCVFPIDAGRHVFHLRLVSFTEASQHVRRN